MPVEHAEQGDEAMGIRGVSSVTCGIYQLRKR